MNAVSYVSIGMFFATLFLTVESFMDMVGINQDYTPNNINVRSCIVSIILFIYILIVGSITFLSLQVNNNDKRFQTLYYFASTFLGLYGIFVMGLMVYNIVTTFQNGFKTGRKILFIFSVSASGHQSDDRTNIPCLYAWHHSHLHHPRHYCF